MVVRGSILWPPRPQISGIIPPPSKTLQGLFGMLPNPFCTNLSLPAPLSSGLTWSEEWIVARNQLAIVPIVNDIEDEFESSLGHQLK